MHSGMLIEALRRIGLDATFDDLCAMLWLADQIGPAKADRERKPDALAVSKPQPASSKSYGRVVPARTPHIEELRHIERDTLADQPVELYGDKPGSGALAQPERVRGVPAVPEPLTIGRALRPVSRRRVGYEAVIDEQATAETIADTGVRTVVCKPVKERWFDFFLISEQMATMAAWQPVQSEFEQLLIRVGGFRRVHALQLDTEADGTLVLRSGAKPINRKSLASRVGRSLVVVMSDCTSAGWYDGRIARWLGELAAEVPVAVGQYLPQLLWPNTAIGFAELRTWSPSLAVPTRRLVVRRPSWAVDEPGIVMPVFSLTPAMISKWARMTASVGHEFGTAALLPLNEIDVDSVGVAGADEVPSAQARLRRFQAFADRNTQLLAAYYSVVRPLTAPVMRVIHQALIPDGGALALAQVMLGGILYPVPAPAERRRDRDNVEYEFYAGLREILSSTLTEPDLVRVNQALHQYLIQLTGMPFDFFALVADAGGSERLPEAALPFVRFARQNFDRFKRDPARQQLAVHALRIKRRGHEFIFSYSTGSLTELWTHDIRPLTEKEVEYGVAKFGQGGRPQPKLALSIFPARLIELLQHSGDDDFCELVLDRDSVKLPWEALLSMVGGPDGTIPRRLGMTRRLLPPAQPYRRHPDASGALVIVCGLAYSSGLLKEVNLDPDTMDALSTLSGGQVQMVVEQEVSSVLQSRPWRIVELIQLDPQVKHASAERGINHDQVRALLTMFDELQYLPELILIDHSAARSIAPVLAERGVPAVIAGPGHSEDYGVVSAACALYRGLSEDACLIDAVRSARRAVPSHLSGNVARVECYGEPNWRFEPATGPAPPTSGSQADVARPLRLFFRRLAQSLGLGRDSPRDRRRDRK